MPVRRRGQRSTRKARSSVAANSAGTPSAPAAGTLAGRARPILLPELPEVLAAMRNLYDDELKPVGRILRKRIAERAASAESGNTTLPDVHGRHLRQVCEASHLISVEPEEGGEWCALLKNVTAKFVDVYSPDDVYPDELWSAAAEYFDQLSGDDILLPGGRYSCAQALARRNLPFLKGRSVGQVCHIVQLAISQKKILGYLNGGVVPYGHSQSMVKEQCVLCRQPCAGPVKSDLVMPIATWEQALTGVRKILDSETERGQSVVPLSNVKRLFRSRFNLELSETMLGHLKLSDLLQDPKFGDVCTVQLKGNGYNVIKQSCRRNISLEEWLPMDEDDCGFDVPCRVAMQMDDTPCSAMTDLFVEVDGVPMFPSTPASRVGPSWPELPPAVLTPSTLRPGGAVRRMVQNTFIHAMLPPPTPVRASKRRAQSVPKDVGTSRDALEASCHELAFLNETVKKKDKLSDSETTAEMSGGSSSEEWDSDNQNDEQTPIFHMRRGPLPEENLMTPPPKAALAQRRPQFLSGPLTLEDSVTSLGPESGWTNVSLSPAKLSRRGQVGRLVRNTFIHAAQPLLTPSPAAARRGASLPRDVGSEKSRWEATYHSLAYLPTRVELATPKATPSPAFLRPGGWSPSQLITPDYCGRGHLHADPLSPPRSRRSSGPVLRLADLL